MKILSVTLGLVLLASSVFPGGIVSGIDTMEAESGAVYTLDATLPEGAGTVYVASGCTDINSRWLILVQLKVGSVWREIARFDLPVNRTLKEFEPVVVNNRSATQVRVILSKR